jgi:hypothetical protein
VPGLNLNLGAGANVAAGPPAPMGAGKPLTAGQAAFGPGYTMTGAPSAAGSLAPNDPFGVALWAGVAAIALLVFIRYSLPA